MMLKKINLKLWLTLVFGLSVYGILFYELFKKAHFDYTVVTLEKVPTAFYLVALTLTVAILFAQGYFLKKVFALYHVALTLKEAIMTWLISIPMGALTFGLSGPLVIFYYARKKSLSSSIAALITISYFIVYSFANVLFITLIGGYSFYHTIHFAPLAKTGLIAAIALLILAAIILLYKKRGPQLLGLVGRWFPKIIGDTKELRWPRLSAPQLAKVIAMGLLVALTYFLLYAFIFWGFASKPSVVLALHGFALSVILSLFAPTGAGLGFVELGLVGLLVLNGESASQAGLIVFSYRLVSFWLPAILGFVLLSLKGHGFLKRLANQN